MSVACPESSDFDPKVSCNDVVNDQKNILPAKSAHKLDHVMILLLADPLSEVLDAHCIEIRGAPSTLSFQASFDQLVFVQTSETKLASCKETSNSRSRSVKVAFE